MKEEDLINRLLNFSAEVIKIVDALPKTLAGKHVAGQLLKSGTSPGANYGEACGAESRADFIHKLGIVLKELKESRYWLNVIKIAKMLSLQHTEPLINECEQLCAIIAKSIVTAREK